MTAPADLTPGMTVRVLRGGVDQHHPTDRVVLDEVQQFGHIINVYDRQGRHVAVEPWPHSSGVTVVPVETQPVLPAGATLDELLAHEARSPAAPAPAFGSVAVRRYTEATGAVRDLADAWDHHAHARAGPRRGAGRAAVTLTKRIIQVTPAQPGTDAYILMEYGDVGWKAEARPVVAWLLCEDVEYDHQVEGLMRPPEGQVSDTSVLPGVRDEHEIVPAIASEIIGGEFWFIRLPGEPEPTQAEINEKIGGAKRERQKERELPARWQR